jgi:hypothetical protein
MNLLHIWKKFLHADGSIAGFLLTQDNTNTGITWTYTHAPNRIETDDLIVRPAEDSNYVRAHGECDRLSILLLSMCIYNFSLGLLSVKI